METVIWLYVLSVILSGICVVLLSVRDYNEGYDLEVKDLVLIFFLVFTPLLNLGIIGLALSNFLIFLVESSNFNKVLIKGKSTERSKTDA